ncbi:MAG: FMN-binding negative transcriptional regulator [Arenibacterium sp.]
MHPNPAFRTTQAQDNLQFARARGFGMLCVQQAPAPLLSHIPFLMSDDLQSADLHLVRSNPIVRMVDGATPAVIAVTGADSYISPDWYAIDDQVPTWNYVAVHLHGVLEPLPKEALLDLLDRQSAAYESRLLPKTPWTTGKMTPEARDRMMRMILPFRFAIDRVEGTWKLGQNKDDAVRFRAAEQVGEHGFGSDAHILAQMMKDT